MAMGTEELLIHRIENDLRKLRLKSKPISSIDINNRIVRLKKLNPNMAEELENKYIKQCKINTDYKY